MKKIFALSFVLLLFALPAMAEPAFEKKCSNPEEYKRDSFIFSSPVVAMFIDKDGTKIYVYQKCSYVPNKEMIELLRGAQK